VESGRVEFTIGAPGEAVPHTEVVGPGAAFHVTPGVVHRMRAVEDSFLLEASTPQLDDVVRLEDSYGRAGTSQP
jgi:quercetin dioxygenase-like cupin family protein